MEGALFSDLFRFLEDEESKWKCPVRLGYRRYCGVVEDVDEGLLPHLWQFLCLQFDSGVSITFKSSKWKRQTGGENRPKVDFNDS